MTKFVIALALTIATLAAVPAAAGPYCQEDLGYGRTSSFGCGVFGVFLRAPGCARGRGALRPDGPGGGHHAKNCSNFGQRSGGCLPGSGYLHQHD